MTKNMFRVWGGGGSRGGISTAGDALISKTADGTDLNEIWAEIQEAMTVYNEQRRNIADLLSFRTTKINDVVPQSFTTEQFEEATEFGLPRAIRPPADYLKLGYNFKDYDLGSRFTWKFLREASDEQIQDYVARVVEADNALRTNSIMNRVFNPQTRTNDWGNTVYGQWNADMTPPPYMGKTFPSSHTHYLATASATLDSNHIEQLLVHVQEHGYGINTGTTMVILLNPTDFETSRISAWRAGEEYRTGGPLPKWDFIPSALMPAWISPDTIHGPVPNSDFNGLQVWGSYGKALVIKSEFTPANYVAVFATGGPNSSLNAVGFREHKDPEWQGLRHLAGPGPYPIVGSTYMRSFGTGVRHRSAAVVAQVTAGTTYTAPTFALPA